MNTDLNEESLPQNKKFPIQGGFCQCDDSCSSQDNQSTERMDSLAHNLGSLIQNTQTELSQMNADVPNLASPNRLLRNNSESQNGENPILLLERRTSAEDVFNSNNLQYLTQNLENLREVLQIVGLNSEIAQSLNIEIQNRNIFDLATAQALNNAQTRILNSQNQVYEQLQQIRSIIDESGIREQQRRLNPLVSRSLNSLVSKLDEQKFQKLFWTGLLFSFFLTMFMTFVTPSSLWSVLKYSNSGQSKLYLLGPSMCYILLLLKFHQKIHQRLLAEEPIAFVKELSKIIPQYSPFYDSGFFILANLDTLGYNISFTMMLWTLFWIILMTKSASIVLQKLNTVMISAHLGYLSDYAALKRIQYVSILYLVLNFAVCIGISWNICKSCQLPFLIVGMLVLSFIEPLKAFLSSTAFIKNYSLIANNNTKHLTDPRFKLELSLDFLHQVLSLCIIGVLSFHYTEFLVGFIVLYSMSFNNVVKKANECIFKYSHWKKLNKKLDEMFPIVEQTKTEDICSICHDSLLVARKLPCGHTFHLKCLFYWIENQKTCPNCRAQVPPVN